MKLIKVIRFIIVFFLFSIGMTLIRESGISLLFYLWILVMGYYALWEFGLLKKKGKKGGKNLSNKK